MGQSFSVEHDFTTSTESPKAIMLLQYSQGVFTPFPFTDFLARPVSYVSTPIIIVEPLGEHNAPVVEPTIAPVPYQDTMRVFHQHFTVAHFQFNGYRLWICTSCQIAQSTVNEATAHLRKLPINKLGCTAAVRAGDIFADLKSVTSFISALRPPQSTARASAPIRTAAVINTGSPALLRRSREGAPFTRKFMNLKPVDTISEGPNTSILDGDACIQVTNGLFIGNEKAACDKEILRTNEITHIVNLASGCSPCPFSQEFEYFVVEMQDSVFAEIPDRFWKALTFVKKALEEGGVVLVHCRRGISRSAALIIAYLMDTMKMTYDNALLFLKSKKPIVNVNAGFAEQLKAREPKRTPGSIGLKKFDLRISLSV